MTDCSTCGHPMVWSDDRERVWCSVYGDHPGALFAGLVALSIEATDEHNASVQTRFKPRLRAAS